MLSLQHHVMLPSDVINHPPIFQAPKHGASTPRKHRRHVRKTWIRFSHGHHGFSPTFWGWRSSNFPFLSSVLDHVRITMTFTISGWSQWGFTGNRWSAFGSLRFGEVCDPWVSRGVCVSSPIPQFLHCVNGYMSPQNHVGSGLLSPACHAMSLGFATSYPSTEVLLDEADREKGPFERDILLHRLILEFRHHSAYQQKEPQVFQAMLKSLNVKNSC